MSRANEMAHFIPLAVMFAIGFAMHALVWDTPQRVFPPIEIAHMDCTAGVGCVLVCNPPFVLIPDQDPAHADRVICGRRDRLLLKGAGR